MNKKIILSLVLISLMMFSLPVGIYLVRQQRVGEVRLRAAPSTTLSISPSTATKNIGDRFTVNITIDTGSNQAVGADLYLSFNSSVLEVLDVTSGSFFDSPQILAKNIDNLSGSITYSLASFTPKQGTGTLAILHLGAKAEGTSPLIFSPSTSVAGLGEEEALQNKVSGSITVTALAVASPSPGVSPSPSADGRGGGLGNGDIGDTSASPSPSPSPGSGGTGGVTSSSPSPSPTPATGTTPTPTASPESLPETGIITPTFFFLTSGGILLLLVFLLI